MRNNTQYQALRTIGLWLCSLLLCLFATGAAADTIISNVVVTYVVTDPAGSPIVETDANGNVVSQVRDQPYGEPTQLVGSQPTTGGDAPGFGGKIIDRTTGLSYFGARYYNPKSGRFMSVDPAGAPEGDPYRFNHYAFGNDNPYRYVDPDGKTPIEGAVFVTIDLVEIGVAAYRGESLTGAMVGLGFDVAGVFSPIPFTGEALKVAEAARAVERTEEVVHTAEGAKDLGEAARYTPGGRFSKATKIEAADRAGYKCEYCGKETTPARKSAKGETPPTNEAQTDHITPKSKGGDNSPDNAAHACRDCNRRLSDSEKPNPRDN